MTSYSEGDPVIVTDKEGSYLGVVVDYIGENALSVQMIKKHQDGLYRITDDAYEVTPASIDRHIHLASDNDVPRAYHTLGYRMLDESTFVSHEDESNGMEAPIGKAEFDLYSSDDESVGSLADFIVDDDQCEPFTLAPGDSKFVQETHQAVRAFNSWAPTTEQDLNTKRFIENQEKRAIVVDDNARFRHNLPGASSYSNPS